MNSLLSLFTKTHQVNLIREGAMYRLTFRGGHLVKEERIEVFGGIDPTNEAVVDRARNGVHHAEHAQDEADTTQKPDAT